MRSELALSKRLRARGEAIVLALDRHPIGGRLTAGTIAKPAYIVYLTQVVHQVRGSAPMLKAAGQRLARENRPEFAELFARKSREELGHDGWALDDLGALGVDRELVEAAEPSSAVNLYSAWVRFCLDHSPIAIFGLAYTLEWLGKERAGVAADRLVANCTIPNIASAVSFLRGHADADIEHIAVLERALDRVEDPDEANLIDFSAQQTGVAYLGFFQRPQRMSWGMPLRNVRPVST
jgi:pyrroloquinoline quinone (PQQ) biosynthesis protein C